jgi:hypothetical protein
VISIRFPSRRPALGWMAVALFSLLGAISLTLPEALPLRGAEPIATSIDLQIPLQVNLGQDVLVRARLTAAGRPVTSRLIQLLLDGRVLRNGSVDANGEVAIPIHGKELSFEHLAQVTVSFRGGADLGPSQSTRAMTVAPAVITVQTVPAVDGIPMTLGTQRAVTLKGRATFPISKAGSYVLTPDVSAVDKSQMRADFVRWADNVFTPWRTLEVTGDETLVLGLHLAYRGSFRFVNSSGHPISSSSIKSITLTSTGGSELTLTKYQDVWLEAGTAVKQLDSLAPSPRSWRLLEVEMAGTNVVNRGQQRITPAPGAIWTVNLLLYDLKVEARDAIFGNLIGGELSLGYPDGSARISQMGKDGSGIDYPQLPRGLYTLQLKVAGLGAPTPVALSRDQTAVIRVITYLDLSLLGFVLIAATGVMAWFGRRQQVLGLARYVRGRSASALDANRVLIRDVADRGGRAYRDRQRAVAAALARQFARLPIDWRSIAQDLGGLRRTLGSDLRRLLAAAGRGWQTAVRGVRVAARTVGLLAEDTADGSAPQPVAEAPSIATFDVARRLRAHIATPESAEASAVDTDSSHGLGKTIGHTWEPSTPILTKGPIDRARRRQMKLEGGTRTCANCGYLMSTYARFCNRCGERVERVD